MLCKNPMSNALAYARTLYMGGVQVRYKHPN